MRWVTIDRSDAVRLPGVERHGYSVPAVLATGRRAGAEPACHVAGERGHLRTPEGVVETRALLQGTDVPLFHEWGALSHTQPGTAPHPLAVAGGV